MKKINKSIVLIALVVVLSVMFVACSGGGEIYYSAWKTTKAPTCTHVGEETRICRADASLNQTRPVPALGHEYGEWEILTPATDTETGLQRAYCVHDRRHYIEETIPMTSSGSTGETKIPAPPAIPNDGEGIFVLAGYAAYISEAKIYALIKDFEAYCNENSIPRVFIGWRMYSSDLLVKDLSDSIRLDNDIDVLLGGGNNIDSAGNLDGGFVVEKSAAATIYSLHRDELNTARRHARMNDDNLTKAFWTYIFTSRATAILTAID